MLETRNFQEKQAINQANLEKIAFDIKNFVAKQYFFSKNVY